MTNIGHARITEVESVNGSAGSSPVAWRANSAAASPIRQLGDRYKIAEELGRGAFGRVYRGIDSRTGQNVAIKQLPLDRIPPSALAGIASEVDLLRGLDHRNVVRYLGSLRTRSHLYIIMELVENGSLAAVIKSARFGPFPEGLVAVYIEQVLAGLAYLHDQGVVHRDIKGANILTTKEGLVKLADFGVAARLDNANGAEPDTEEDTQPAGTPYWMAPEVVELKAVTTASDIWSVGCLAVELLTGQPPYFDLQPLSALYRIVQDTHPPLPPGASPSMQDFLLQCFRKESTQRPSAKALLHHRWIAYHRRNLREAWGRAKEAERPPNTEAQATVASVVERLLAAGDLEAAASSGAEGSKNGQRPVGSGVDLAPSNHNRRGADELYLDSASEVSTNSVFEGAPTSTESGALADEEAQQEDFLRKLQEDPTGAQLLVDIERMVFSATSNMALSNLSSRREIAAGKVGEPTPSAMGAFSAAAPSTNAPSSVAEAEVRRQTSSLRIMAPPGERSLVEEAAAAASARALVGYLASSSALRAAFVAADGLCGLRELLDSPSERVLVPAMDLLLTLVSQDANAADLACVYGLVPAGMRFAGPQHPLELRLLSARFANILVQSSAAAAHMLVACQGVPFLSSMMDEGAQTQEQLELLAAATSGFWALLLRSNTPGWPLGTNAYLRLMAHHGVPQRIVRSLPWVLKHASVAASQAGHRSRSFSALPRPAVPASAAAAAANLNADDEDKEAYALDPTTTKYVPPPPALMGLRPSNRIVPEETVHSNSLQSTSETLCGTEISSAEQLLCAMVNLFAALTYGDAIVKARCCHLETINGMFGLTVRMGPELQLIILGSVCRLSTEQAVLHALEAANAVKYAVAQLARTDGPALQLEGLLLLQHLCQLSKARQERAASEGAVPWLCRLALRPPVVEGQADMATRGAAAAATILCSLTHCGPPTRAELWSSGALDVLLQLLKEEVHQPSVLEALAAWLDSELPRLEPSLLEDTAVARLVLLLPDSATNARASRLSSLLSPMARMIARSPRLAVALASAGLATRVAVLLRRPSPPVALALLEILRLLYEANPHPKDFVARNRLGPTIMALAQGAQAGEQVLVRRQANNLLQAFSVHNVF